MLTKPDGSVELSKTEWEKLVALLGEDRGWSETEIMNAIREGVRSACDSNTFPAFYDEMPEYGRLNAVSDSTNSDDETKKG